VKRRCSDLPPRGPRRPAVRGRTLAASRPTPASLGEEPRMRGEGLPLDAPASLGRTVPLLTLGGTRTIGWCDLRRRAALRRLGDAEFTSLHFTSSRARTNKTVSKVERDSSPAAAGAVLAEGLPPHPLPPQPASSAERQPTEPAAVRLLTCTPGAPVVSRSDVSTTSARPRSSPTA
jgi:hypothetical protein